MQLTHLLAFSLAGLTMAAQQAPMDAPAIKSLMSTLNTNFASISKSIEAITEANVATQVALVVKQMESLNIALLDGSTKLKSSKALGLLDMSSLGTAMTPVQKSMTTLLNDIITKRPIIVKGNQADALGKGMKKQQAGFLALTDAFQTQIPATLAGQIPKAGAAGAAPAGFNVDAVAFEDLMFEVVMAVFKGTDTSVKVSGSIWPLPGGAAAGAADAAPAKGVSSAKAPAKGVTPTKGIKRGVEFRV